MDLQRHYFERVIDDLKDLLDEREASRSKAVDALQLETQERFKGVNEFRQTLTDQATTFMTRAEALARHDRHDADVAAINKRLDLSQGSATGLDKAWGYIIGAIGLAGTVIAIIITTR